MWYVIGLIWIALIVGLVAVYNRRQRQHNAARAEKMAELLADAKPAPAAGMSSRVAAVAPTAGAEFRKKQRLLPQSTALLYYVFRTGLPDHEIFTGLALADVVVAGSAAGVTGAEQLSNLLARRLDLVVCTKQLEVVAGVVIGAGAGGFNDDAVAHALRAAGIRMVRIDPAAPPRHHQVRELIYGEGG